MAILAFTNAKVVINSIDFSSYTKDVTVEFNAADLNSTAMSVTGWETHLGGLKSGKFDAVLNQDYAASQVDATIWAALGTVVPVTVNPTSAANSATNPAYTFNVLVTNVPGPTGKVGDLLEAKISWIITGAVTRIIV
jgi:ABC-type amino acid transport substrate-binding protein